MEKLKLYNTLTREKQEFKPIKRGFVGLYTCGPTVYNYAHIGNLRTYIFEDILKRVLLYNNYKVKHVMNITDVGHLTGDRDMGEDRLEKEAKLENKSAWDIAKFYTSEFKKNLKDLNILEPNIWCRATDYIKEQIKLVQILEKKGYTYKTSDGIYFDTSKFPDYNKLSHQKLENLQEGARIEKNDEKKNPTDFALWKFSSKNEKRQMEWKSPWGIGFPGWHIECSAMSIKKLGKEFDIHCGGIDAVNIHHTNERAQNNCSIFNGKNEKEVVKFWIHGEFLNIASGYKMAKSEGNFLILQSLIDKNINPLAFRLMCLGTHYRKPLIYSETAIQNFNVVLNNIINGYRSILEKINPKNEIKEKINEQILDKFEGAINEDMNMAVAFSYYYDIITSNNDLYSPEQRKKTALKMDKVIGLNLKDIKIEKIEIPENVKSLAKKRLQARKEKNWTESDKLRNEINKLGYDIEDTGDNYNLKKK